VAQLQVVLEGTSQPRILAVEVHDHAAADHPHADHPSGGPATTGGN
jgi:hypothetical protein